MPMKRIVVLICGVFFGSCLSFLRAGDVISLSNAPTIEGTVTFADATDLQVQREADSAPENSA